ncbi:MULTISPECIES: YceI family protein [Acinetobacter]|jgi:polyisoprenoid-binding protein YceI|uniref:Polyisoprenoid-binding protein n=2 Tax=Gammaproteobacteria TaxID=1236 RepID=A0ABU6DRK4_9GAMM|nr:MULTISPECIES: YceI family protein [Acinetobacter]MBF7691068.1 polyisoprenoid-binding protein [Acinetobacter pollinis]MBF7693644.1 polyisoprenoid-binding protein [Acinetobacter pollinis]MBF7698707.1 polyisoprenoid-binding protein [Acinetobacter pollinis]MBF7701483.1 polyisoprenoid-binding protein [Acinetobacter pollinis]MEB5476048.1 polyisoprenoid-binding protein [Acinetobacter pollinis]
MFNKKALLGLSLGLMSAVTFAAPITYKIDPAHTATLFSWNHFGFSTPTANFSDIQGDIQVDEAHPEKSSVNVTIPVSSVNTNVSALDKEFQEAAWFNSAQYPNITFKSTRVETKDKKHFKIFGDLTVKGTTKPVVLNATLNKQGVHPMKKVAAIGFNATTSFDRSAFGIGNYVPNVSDKITVNITTEASVDK